MYTLLLRMFSPDLRTPSVGRPTPQTTNSAGDDGEQRHCACARLLVPTSSSFIVFEVSAGGGIYLRENCLLTPRTTANYRRVDKAACAVWAPHRRHQVTVGSTHRPTDHRQRTDKVACNCVLSCRRPQRVQRSRGGYEGKKMPTRVERVKTSRGRV